MRRRYTAWIAAMLGAAATAGPTRHAAAQSPAPSPSAPPAAIVAVADSLLATLTTHDTVTARRLLAPGARLVSISVETGRTSAQTDSMFLHTVGERAAKYLERMWTPTVSLEGPMAVVSGRYDFHIDGNFSHCGTDVFTLMRGASGWRVVALAWTTQRTGCEPSPLGTPKG